MNSQDAVDGCEPGDTHLAISSFTRLANSSLYSSATRLEYLFLVSESDRSVDPPCFVKKSVADAFPPTFIVLSWHRDLPASQSPAIKEVSFGPRDERAMSETHRAVDYARIVGV